MNTRILLAACVALSTSAIPVHAAQLSPTLQTKLAAIAPTDSAGLVIISFKTANGLPPNLPDFLANYNITTIRRLSALGMVTAVLTKEQITAVQGDPSVLSVWDNSRLYYSLSQARVLCGVDRLRADAAMTALNGGHVVDGAGLGDPVPGPAATNKPQFSVAVIDSGIDTAGTVVGSSVPRDLPFDVITAATGVIPTSKVLQNVQVVPDLAGTGQATYLENQQNDDSVGHGSHCSGIVGGTGAYSKTVPATSGPNASVNSPMIGKTQDFSGVASGAKIVGLGSGAVLFILGALESFEYVLENQTKYNIRITSNSYGSVGNYDPADPVNLAIETAHANGITSVFAAGNSGPGVDTISNSAKSPYVISVAAGTKEGGLASFSSRGLPVAERPVGSINEFNLPAITAPGTGREFPENGPADPAGTSGTEANPNANAKGFYSDIISTRSLIGGTAAGTNDQEFPTPYQANYTQISGTSMACPFIAGVCALLLDANPNLTPDQIKSILQDTATHTPGYSDFETGAGYVNAFAAVDKAFTPGKTYQPFTLTDADYVAKVTSTNLPPPSRPVGYPPTATMGDANSGEQFALTYNTASVGAADYPAAKTKAMTNDNAYAFSVGPDATTGKLPSVIDARLLFGQDGVTGAVGGNSLGFYLWAPDGTFYASGVALPVLDSPSRQVVVQNPTPGLWVLELRGLRGLAAIPVTPPTGVALPDNTTGSVRRISNTVPEPNDIAEAGQRDQIRAALAARYMDAFPDPKNANGILFLPTATVTRGDFLKALVINTPLRQSLASTAPRFTDVSSTVSRWAEAASQNGSTLRDFDFTPKPVLETSAGPSFSPNTAMSRAKAAVAMVRALGLDREARALRDIPMVTYTYKGVAYPVQDITAYNPSEPGANQENGYLQLAINRGLLPIVPTVRGTTVSVKATPTRPLVRGDLAIVLNNYRRFFQFGNKFDAATESPTGQTPAN